MVLDDLSRKNSLIKTGVIFSILVENFRIAHETKLRAGVFYTHLRQSPIAKIMRFIQLINIRLIVIKSTMAGYFSISKYRISNIFLPFLSVYGGVK